MARMTRELREARAARLAGEDLIPEHILRLADMIGAYETTGDALRLFAAAFRLSAEACVSEGGLPASVPGLFERQQKLLDGFAGSAELAQLDEAILNAD